MSEKQNVSPKQKIIDVVFQLLYAEYSICPTLFPSRTINFYTHPHILHTVHIDNRKSYFLTFK